MGHAKASAREFIERGNRRDRGAVIVDGHDPPSSRCHSTRVAIQVSLRRVAVAGCAADVAAGVAGAGAETAGAGGVGVGAGPRRAGLPGPCGWKASTIASMIEIPGGGRSGPVSRHPVPGACGTGGAASAAARCSSSDFGRPPPGILEGIAATPRVVDHSHHCGAKFALLAQARQAFRYVVDVAEHYECDIFGAHLLVLSVVVEFSDFVEWSIEPHVRDLGIPTDRRVGLEAEYAEVQHSSVEF